MLCSHLFSIGAVRALNCIQHDGALCKPENENEDANTKVQEVVQLSKYQKQQKVQFLDMIFQDESPKPAQTMYSQQT